MKNTSYRYWMIYVIAIVAAMGGLLFGFDTGVISGAIPFFQKDFGIDDSYFLRFAGSYSGSAVLW